MRNTPRTKQISCQTKGILDQVTYCIVCHPWSSLLLFQTCMTHSSVEHKISHFEKCPMGSNVVCFLTLFKISCSTEKNIHTKLEWHERDPLITVDLLIFEHRCSCKTLFTKLHFRSLVVSLKKKEKREEKDIVKLNRHWVMQLYNNPKHRTKPTSEWRKKRKHWSGTV